MESPATTTNTQTRSLPPVWPIALARHIRAHIADAPGFILFVFGLALVALGTYGSIMLHYEITLWRQSWQLVWPGISGLPLLFPFVLLVIGSLLGRVLHGRIWCVLLIGLYMVLQLKATHPEVLWSELARLIQKQPALLLPALWHSLLPSFVLLIVVALLIELAGPALHAAITIYHAAQRAREQVRHNAALRTLESEAFHAQETHQRALLELDVQQRYIEIATQRRLLLQLAATPTIVGEHPSGQTLGHSVPATSPAADTDLLDGLLKQGN
ncbi:MAG TPA: hypothetical protein VGD58_28250 [Herpetosiphonaceae bacterium]